MKANQDPSAIITPDNVIRIPVIKKATILQEGSFSLDTRVKAINAIPRKIPIHAMIKTGLMLAFPPLIPFPDGSAGAVQKSPLRLLPGWYSAEDRNEIHLPAERHS